VLPVRGARIGLVKLGLGEAHRLRMPTRAL
jgi:hypothetical protein